MIFKYPELDGAIQSDEILYLGYYFPIHTDGEGERSALYVADERLSGISSNIFSLKSQNPNSNFFHKGAILYFGSFIVKLVHKDVFIAVVPSSTVKNDPEYKGHGITQVVELLVTQKCCQDGLSFLTRSHSVDKAATGGNRAQQVHVDSIVAIPEVAGKTILLLDDVTSSGSSMRVCRDKLREAGAARVVCLAIGKTYHERFLMQVESDAQKRLLGLSVRAGKSIVEAPAHNKSDYVKWMQKKGKALSMEANHRLYAEQRTRHDEQRRLIQITAGSSANMHFAAPQGIAPSRGPSQSPALRAKPSSEDGSDD